MVTKSLGRYQLHTRLGRGGMGEVWLASARGAAGFEKMVAVKCLHSRFSKDVERTRGLLREAMLGVSLDHEHVVQVFDLGEDEGTYFVAMEYVRGYSLAHVLQYLAARGQKMPVRYAVYLVRALCRALEYVHAEHGDADRAIALVHGDVSPSNLLLSLDGRIKLSDFGVAAIDSERGDPIVGKLAYLPPEALAGSRRAQSWDVYAACVVLLAALAGLPTPQAVKDAVRGVVRGKPGDVLGRDDVSAALVSVLTTGLSPQPERRFADARALRKALDQALPRDVDDADDYAAWIAGIFSSDSFIGAHGELPATGGFSDEVEMSPFLAETMAVETEQSTLKVRRSRPIRFGLSPAMGAEGAREIGAQIGATLSRLLERDIVPVVLGDYRALVDTLCVGEVDLAWMPPVAYLQAWERGATVLAAAVREGDATYESALFVRSDSPAAQVSDLKGCSAAWVNRDSASGYVFAAALIVESLGPLAEVLGRQHFFGSHTAVCEAVMNGWADFGATYAVRDPAGRLHASGWTDASIDDAEMRVIGYSHPIPGDNISCRPAFPSKLREGLQEILGRLHEDRGGEMLLDTIFHAQRFAVVEHDLYEPVRSIIAAVQR